MIRRILPLAIVICLSPSVVTAQAFHRVTKDEAIAAAKTAAATTSDSDRFLAQFQREIQKLAPGYNGQPLWVSTGESMWIAVMGPVLSYGRDVAERVRKMELVDSVEWKDQVLLVVSPQRINAPDIIKVVVARDGQQITPTDSHEFIVHELTTAIGAKVSLHGGQISYEISAFDPGATIIVTAIPESGANIARAFGDRDLRKFQ